MKHLKVIRVELLTSPASIDEQIHNAALAALTCTANEANLDKPNYDKLALLKRIVGMGHESVIEHINLTFEIKDISRALLQELARHRHISLSVQSTRWTLKKVNTQQMANVMDARAYCVPRKSEDWKYQQAFDQLANDLYTYMQAIANLIEKGEEPDTVKYFLPELWPVKLVMTCNLRELRYILRLRSKPSALWEFQNLCEAIADALPENIRQLLKLKTANHE